MLTISLTTILNFNHHPPFNCAIEFNLYFSISKNEIIIKFKTNNNKAKKE